VLLAYSQLLFGQDAIRPEGVYKVLPGDLLQISVWGEQDLRGEVLVRPDGAFSFPLCGDISARNKSVAELQTEISAKLQKYIATPVVTVSVTQVSGNRVYVIGQVNQPGVFVVNPNVDVLQALSMAGGGTPFANLNDIRILRRVDSSQRTLQFRYDDVARGKNLEQNIMLQAGDVVIVP
jgi:polysaccharide export outer membrane protein